MGLNRVVRIRGVDLFDPTWLHIVNEQGSQHFVHWHVRPEGALDRPSQPTLRSCNIKLIADNVYRGAIYF